MLQKKGKDKLYCLIKMSQIQCLSVGQPTPLTYNALPSPVICPPNLCKMYKYKIVENVEWTKPWYFKDPLHSNLNLLKVFHIEWRFVFQHFLWINQIDCLSSISTTKLSQSKDSAWIRNTYVNMYDIDMTYIFSFRLAQLINRLDRSLCNSSMFCLPR